MNIASLITHIHELRITVRKPVSCENGHNSVYLKLFVNLILQLMAFINTTCINFIRGNKKLAANIALLTLYNSSYFKKLPVL